jgi:hypothetical protein
MLFEADPDHIATLDSVTLIQLMKRLMLAESRLAGIPLRGAAAPLQVTVADGGEDGRVEWTGGSPATAYFPHRFTLFQAKAQDLTDGTVKAEVLKKQKKGPSRLSPAIVEVLSRGGAYVIFCHRPFVTAKRQKLVTAIKTAISAGGADPKKAAAVEVYDANLIADWVMVHPPVAVWLASLRFGRPLHGFQTLERWGLAPDISGVPWKLSATPRFVPANRNIPKSERVDPDRAAWTFEQAVGAIQEFLAKDRAVVRLAGPSGFGKTRFAFELLSGTNTIADEVDAASVIYADGSLSGDEAVKLALEMADTAQAAILVVDECTDDLHLKLAQMAQRANSRLRLITIDIETKILQAVDTLSIRVEKADDGHIQAIAKGVAPTLTDADSRFISDLAEGFPRMAVLAAQQNGDSRQTLESAEQVLDRVIWGTKPRVPGAQKALEIASLFEWLGIEGRVEDQVAFVAAELAGMSTAVFVEQLLSFRNRGILTQRGDFIQVGPVPLAARLALQRLSVVTAEQLLTFFQKAPAGLKASVLSRLKWLDLSPTAKAFARRLLDPNILGNLAALNTEFGSKTLDRLVHVDPDAVAATVDRVFGGMTIDELRAVRDGRRHLVWALDKLVFREKSFDRAARLLRRLAVAENETWGNNASGEFKQLYHLHLSGTEAAAQARLLVLDEGLASDNPNERELCVDALGEMLTTGHFSRSGGVEQIGTAEPLKDWSPKTYGEIWDFYRAAMQRLTALATRNDPLAQKAKALLGSHIRGLIRHVPFKDVEGMIDAINAHYGFWPEALSRLSDWLYFDRKGAPPKNANEVRGLFDRMMPTDPIELAILYTIGWQAEFHDPDADYDSAPAAKHDFEYAARQARLVSETIAQDDILVRQAVERLACSEAKSVYPFARQLAISVADPEALFTSAVQVAEAATTSPNRQFFSGLISGAADREPKLAKTLVRVALRSTKLKAEAISLIGSGPLQPDDIALVISLLQSKDVHAWQCANLAYGNHLTPDAFLPLLEELEKYGADGLWTILDIISLYLHGGTHQPTKRLIKVLKRVLLAPRLLEKTRNNMDGYHLAELVSRLAKLGAISPSYARSLTKQLLRICEKRSDRVFYELDDSVRKSLGAMISIHPAEVWKEIAKAVTSRSWHVRFHAEHLLASSHGDDHLARGLSFNVPPAIYLAWVREKPTKRAASAVAWLAIAAKDDEGSLCWERETEDFIREFGDEPDVLSAMSSRLHPSSWSGSLAPHLEPLVPLLETWRGHSNPTVRRWVDAQIDWLRKGIVVETKRSEEDVVRYL